MNNEIKIDDLIRAQQKIIEAVKQKDSQLNEIKNSSEPIVNRWQQLLDILLPIQLEVATECGFKNDQLGLMEFNKLLMEKQIIHPILSSLNEQKWDYIFNMGFGITNTNAPKFSLEQAQNLINDMTKEITQEVFLIKIDTTMSKLPLHSSMVEKRQALLSLLLPLQVSVMEKYGFTGDTGYVLAQKALFEYYNDPVIMKSFSYAQETIFKRANLISV